MTSGTVVPERSRDGRARFALLLAFVIAFSIFKVACLLGLARAWEMALDCAFDASLWALCWLLSEAVAGRGSPRREWAAGALFYPFLYGSGALVFAHTWFYDSAIERRLTAMDVSTSGIAAFFHELPRTGHFALAGLVLGLHALALVFLKLVRRPSFSRAFPVVLVLCAASAVSSLLAPSTPSVLFDTGHGLWQFVSLPRVRATPVAKSVQQRNTLDKSGGAALPVPRFKKVIVLVMETMTSERVERELSGVPASSFFRTREHVHAAAPICCSRASLQDRAWSLRRGRSWTCSSDIGSASSARSACAEGGMAVTTRRMGARRRRSTTSSAVRPQRRISTRY